MNCRDSLSASDDPIILRGIDLTANRVQMSDQLVAMSLLGGYRSTEQARIQNSEGILNSTLPEYRSGIRPLRITVMVAQLVFQVYHSRSVQASEVAEELVRYSGN